MGCTWYWGRRRLRVRYPIGRQRSILSPVADAPLLTRHQKPSKARQSGLLSRALVVVVFLDGPPASLSAQEIASARGSNLSLQKLPASETPVRTPAPGSVRPPSSAVIAITIRDTNGSAVPGLQVTLIGQNNAADHVLRADSTGVFTFADLPPGTYRVQITAAGVEPYLSDDVAIGAGQKTELPLVVMRIPTKTTTVDVVATVNEVAQAQVKQQEQQHVLGFLPNFYTSYIWNAEPLPAKLKFKLTLRSVTDPFVFMMTGAMAGVEQSHNTFPGYGQGLRGYAKRYGATYADTVTLRMLGSAVLPAILHQDPRYFYQGSGTTRSRLLHALAASFVRRGDNGRLQPNYSQLLGNFTTAGLSNFYRAPADRTVGVTFRNGFAITAGGAFENVLREFFSRKMTPNIPSFANGKP